MQDDFGTQSSYIAWGKSIAIVVALLAAAVASAAFVHLMN